MLEAGSTGDLLTDGAVQRESKGETGKTRWTILPLTGVEGKSQNLGVKYAFLFKYDSFQMLIRQSRDMSTRQMDMGVWRSGLGKQIGTSLYGKDLVIQGEAVARGSGHAEAAL